jgi:hypothetical protein
MQPIQEKYPFFEPNQVLTNRHLNQVFDYLDEQDRLSRANLIGIGIVCGLEIELVGTTTVKISKGCGITSEGYLIVEPKAVDLVKYKLYNLPPSGYDYLPFHDQTVPSKPQFILWEMLTASESDTDTTLLENSPTFLDDKAVLLFLELKKDDLKNCSPNSCDDKGIEIGVRVRRLLIKKTDLSKILAATNSLDTDLTPADIEAALSARFNLADLRMPRYDVPNTSPTTSDNVLNAFITLFQEETLVKNTYVALKTAYIAFRPIVEKVYSGNPFSSFNANFGFLETAPVNTMQVRFLQYYYDFFDDLLKAYEEFRLEGLELLCACCPPSALFSRHLMLGSLKPAAGENPLIYRHVFLASSAISGCEEQTEKVILLFQRLVEMTKRFTNNPPLPVLQPNVRYSRDPQIRITPSKYGDVPLSEKSIPYYYLQNVTPALYRLWNPAKSHRKRAYLNLSFRADEYSAPEAPAFVLNPLNYDLEPYNFLRVEGHLGKNYQNVLFALDQLKQQFRLPIEFIALKTGALNENAEFDLNKANCNFKDLESSFVTLTAEVMRYLCNEIQFFYDLEWPMNSNQADRVPKLPWLAACSPSYKVKKNTLGEGFEAEYLDDLLPGALYKNINIRRSRIFMNLSEAEVVFYPFYYQQVYDFLYIIMLLSMLPEYLSKELKELKLDTINIIFTELSETAKALESSLSLYISTNANAKNIINWEGIDDRLESIINASYLDQFKSLIGEYHKRVIHAQQKQYLSNFLNNHPGIQHKGGAPIGGTFILVYHEEPVISSIIPDTGFWGVNDSQIPMLRNQKVAVTTKFGGTLQQQPTIKEAAVLEALISIRKNPLLVRDKDIQLLLGVYTGMVPDLNVAFLPEAEAGEKNIITKTVEEMADGTVIADFFLPYICCSDCAPIQFVLPKIPPVFTVVITCTNNANQAEVTVKPEGGVLPYSVKVDSQPFVVLGTNNLSLAAGAHTLTIKDAEGTESAPKIIDIPAKLSTTEPKFTCQAGVNKYTVEMKITGGIKPYKANGGEVIDDIYKRVDLPGDVETEIIITDHNECTFSRKVRKSCLPPLSFTAITGCAAGNKAPVTLNVQSGETPYSAKAGATGNYIPIADLKELPVGTTRVFVRDAKGTEVSQDVTVAPPLLLEVLEKLCDDKNESYHAILRVSGGTQPYRMKGSIENLKESVFSSGQIKSGDSVVIEVVDAKECSARVTVQHVCCDLPCNGIVKRCAYRLWLQPGGKIQSYTVTSPGISLVYEGKAISLDRQLLEASPAELTTNFDATMRKMIENLNAAIAKKIGGNLVMVSYQPSGNDPFAMLWIEHFQCQTFSFEFDYTVGIENISSRNHVTYTNLPGRDGTPFDGAIFRDRGRDSVATVPAFSCTIQDECKKTPPEPVGGESKPAIDISDLAVRGKRLFASGKLAGDTFIKNKVIAWIWDFKGGSAPFYAGESIDIEIDSTLLSQTISLTAITITGQFNHISKFIPRP